MKKSFYGTAFLLAVLSFVSCRAHEFAGSKSSYGTAVKYMLIKRRFENKKWVDVREAVHQEDSSSSDSDSSSSSSQSDHCLPGEMLTENGVFFRSFFFFSLPLLNQ